VAIGGIGWELLRTLFSWWLTNVPLRLGFDRQVAKDLLHYCKFFLGSSILMSLYLSLDQLVIGKIKGTESLGLYGFALQWVSPLGIVSAAVFGGVALPVYAKLQDDKDRLLRSYCRILTYSALISTGLLTGLVTVVPEAVRLALRPEYRPTIPIFQILGLYWIVRSIDNTSGQLYAGIGKPKYDMYLNAVNLVAMAVPMVPLVRAAGPVGAGYALVFARLVRFALNAVFCRRALGCSMAPLAKSLLPALVASGAMAAVLWGIKAVVPHVGGIAGWARLGALVAVGAGVYLGVLYGSYRSLLREMVGLVRDALMPRRAKAYAAAE
jgi:O-antigen/teichoic acid export membrane protein